MRKTNRGFTLTELAIVLGVIGSILGGIWVAASQARQQQKYNNAAQEILTIVQNMRTLYGNMVQFPYATYGHLDITTRLANSNVFPSNMIIPVSTSVPDGVTNPWGTQTIVYYASSSAFEIQMDQVPIDACKNIYANLIPKAMQVGMINYWDNLNGWTSTAINPDITQVNCSAGNMSTQFNLH